MPKKSSLILFGIITYGIGLLMDWRLMVSMSLSYILITFAIGKTGIDKLMSLDEDDSLYNSAMCMVLVAIELLTVMLYKIFCK